MWLLRKKTEVALRPVWTSHFSHTDFPLATIGLKNKIISSNTRYWITALTQPFVVDTLVEVTTCICTDAGVLRSLIPNVVAIWIGKSYLFINIRIQDGRDLNIFVTKRVQSSPSFSSFVIVFARHTRRKAAFSSLTVISVPVISQLPGFSATFYFLGLAHWLCSAILLWILVFSMRALEIIASTIEASL